MFYGIEYRRGEIEILDLKGLKAASCSCYQVIQAAFKRAQYPAVAVG
jgi:hypothetical protein